MQGQLTLAGLLVIFSTADAAALIKPDPTLGRLVTICSIGIASDSPIRGYVASDSPIRSYIDSDSPIRGYIQSPISLKTLNPPKPTLFKISVNVLSDCFCCDVPAHCS